MGLLTSSKSLSKQAILAEETAFQTLAAEEEALSASIKAAEKIERDRIWESQRSAREAQAIADELAAVVAAQIKKELEKEKAKAKKVENEKKKEKERRTAEVRSCSLFFSRVLSK